MHSENLLFVVSWLWTCTIKQHKEQWNFKNQNTKFPPKYETTSDTKQTCYSIYPIYLVQQTPNKNSWRQTTYKPSLLCVYALYAYITENYLGFSPHILSDWPENSKWSRIHKIGDFYATNKFSKKVYKKA